MYITGACVHHGINFHLQGSPMFVAWYIME